MSYWRHSARTWRRSHLLITEVAAVQSVSSDEQLDGEWTEACTISVDSFDSQWNHSGPTQFIISRVGRLKLDLHQEVMVPSFILDITNIHKLTGWLSNLDKTKLIYRQVIFTRPLAAFQICAGVFSSTSSNASHLPSEKLAGEDTVKYSSTLPRRHVS